MIIYLSKFIVKIKKIVILKLYDLLIKKVIHSLIYNYLFRYKIINPTIIYKIINLLSKLRNYQTYYQF